MVAAQRAAAPLVLLVLSVSCAHLGDALRVAVLVSGHPAHSSHGADLAPVLPMVLESIRSRVLDRLRSHGHEVATILCMQLPRTSRELEYGVLRLHALRELDDSQLDGAAGGPHAQWSRLDACHAALLAAAAAAAPPATPFDWFVRLRPDVMLWSDAPDVGDLDAASIHARLYAADRLASVAAASFADHVLCGSGGGGCMPGPCASSCAMYDDQIAFVPAAMAGAYFGLRDHIQGRPAPADCAWTQSMFMEGQFTRAVLRRNGSFTPLKHMLARMAVWGPRQRDAGRAADFRACFPDREGGAASWSQYDDAWLD